MRVFFFVVFFFFAFVVVVFSIKKYSYNFSFLQENTCCGTHKKCLSKALLICTHNVFLSRNEKYLDFISGFIPPLIQNYGLFLYIFFFFFFVSKLFKKILNN